MTAKNKRVSASNYQMLLSPRVNLSCCLFFPPASQKKANFASYRPIFYKIPSKFSARNTVPARVLSHSQICQPAQFSLRSGYFEDRLRWALLTLYFLLICITSKGMFARQVWAGYHTMIRSGLQLNVAVVVETLRGI